MNWMGLVAGVCWAFLGAGGASLVWGWWMRRAVRRARVLRASEVLAFQRVFDDWKNRPRLHGWPRFEFEQMARRCARRVEAIMKGRA